MSELRQEIARIIHNNNEIKRVPICDECYALADKIITLIKPNPETKPKCDICGEIIYTGYCANCIMMRGGTQKKSQEKIEQMEDWYEPEYINSALYRTIRKLNELIRRINKE